MAALTFGVGERPGGGGVSGGPADLSIVAAATPATAVRAALDHGRRLSPRSRAPRGRARRRAAPRAAVVVTEDGAATRAAADTHATSHADHEEHADDEERLAHEDH